MPQPAANTNPAKDLVPQLEKLTPAQFEAVRKQVSQLILRQDTAASERFQFFLTKPEAKAIRAIAKREKMPAAKLFRLYLRCLHPELATLTARTKNALVEQQKLISALIGDERMDMAKLAKALADLEKRTGELMRLIEERR